MSPKLGSLLSQLAGEERSFAANETLFRLGDSVRSLHIVRAGIIHLVRYRRDGSPLILQRAVAESILAEASVYAAHYNCDARAETDAVTWAVPLREVRAHLSTDRDLSDAWASHLAHEVQRARLHAEILSLRTVEARLDAWIAWNGSMPSKGQWSVIAAELSVSPEALYREIARRRER